MKTLEFEINKENAALLTTNDAEVYVIGHGYESGLSVQGYAKEVECQYNNSILVDKSPKNINSYHVLTWKLKQMLLAIEYKETFEFEGKNYKIVDSYVGVYDRCRITVHYPYGRRGSTGAFKSEGERMEDMEERFKFIVEVEELK